MAKNGKEWHTHSAGAATSNASSQALVRWSQKRHRFFEFAFLLCKPTHTPVQRNHVSCKAVQRNFFCRNFLAMQG
jgi:hypothetical protein